MVTYGFSSLSADGLGGQGRDALATPCGWLGGAKGGTPSLPPADAFGGTAVVVDGDVLRGDDVEIHRPGGIVVQPMDSGFVEVNELAVTDFEGGVRGRTAPPALGVSFRAWTTTAVGQINVGKSDIGDGSDIVAVDVGCQRRLAANL